MSENYNNHYNESAFWDKIKGMGKKVGKSLIGNALLLFYVLQDRDTPLVDKGVIIGALDILYFL